jgi:hypothetical protein
MLKSKAGKRDCMLREYMALEKIETGRKLEMTFQIKES